LNEAKLIPPSRVGLKEALEGFDKITPSAVDIPFPRNL
jgi:hypothetical protein